MPSERPLDDALGTHAPARDVVALHERICVRRLDETKRVRPRAHGRLTQHRIGPRIAVPLQPVVPAHLRGRVRGHVLEQHRVPRERSGVLVHAHHVGIAPNHERGVGVVLREQDVRVHVHLVAEVVVLGHDVVHDAVGGERALEYRREPTVDVTLVMHHDTGPAERGAGPGGQDDAGGVLAHAIEGGRGGDDFAPVSFHRRAQERLGVRGDAGAVGGGGIVGHAGCGVDEVLVRAKVEMEGVAEGGEGEAEGVCVVERFGVEGEGRDIVSAGGEAVAG